MKYDTVRHVWLDEPEPEEKSLDINFRMVIGCLVLAWVLVWVMALVIGLYVRPSPYIERDTRPVLSCPAPDLDTECGSWLFNTNLLDARKRICSGK